MDFISVTQTGKELHIFTTSDGGRNWEKKFSPGGGWNCNNIVIQDSILYCSFYDLVRRGVTVNRGRVMSSTDFGSTWKDHLLLNDEVQQLLVADQTIAVQLLSVSKRDGKKTYDIGYSIVFHMAMIKFIVFIVLITPFHIVSLKTKLPLM